MLNQSEQNQLCQKLRDLHSNDQKQLEVIFSESKRLIVEAPAGYGKTKTMISTDMEQYSMPNWYGLCGNCNHKSNCNLTVNSSNENKFLEELSVFYVGVTRARKQIFFSASKNRLKADGTTQKANLSCMLKLPGIVLPEI